MLANQNKGKQQLDKIWKSLEASHADTYSMHESFNVDDPHAYTRRW